MAQFCVYQNTNVKTRNSYPYLLDIQSNLLQDLRTVLVIPLVSTTRIVEKNITRLCPKVEIDGRQWIVMTQQMAAIERALLGHHVADLSSYRHQLIAALDFIISGI